jgi:DNA (cytosine-5)-methyltransferase 1
VHPTEDRALTLRECARLQSFDDAYNFSGSSGSVARQIGNAVPPLAGEVLAKMILSVEGTLGTGNVIPIKSAQPGLLGFHLTSANGMSPALARTHALLESLRDELRLFDEEEQRAAG